MIAGRIVRALLAKDRDAIEGQMSSEIQFRALVPGSGVELDGPDAAVGVVSDWFGPEVRGAEVLCSGWLAASDHA